MEIDLYFKDLSAVQKKQLTALPDLYKEWNSKINVISRKDMTNIWEHHILHSLAIAKFINFKKTTRCLDLGTGGGLPGIPLAILFPEVHFTLIDGTAKKILVANEISQALGLKNCIAYHQRAEDVEEKFDFVLARAVTRLQKLYEYCIPLISNTHKNAKPNGLITLKGGNLEEECKEINKYFEMCEISKIFSEDYFKNKYIVYVPIIK